MSNPEEQKAIGEILRGIDRPVIVELGAHVGEEYQWLSTYNPERYVMVEPDPENLKRILNLPVSVRAAAVGAYNSSKVPFHASMNHQAHNRASGSIRQPTGHLKHFPEVTFSEITVPLRTLDAIWAQENLHRIDLLWVDIQGAERDMIAGGQQALAVTRYMMIEAEPEVELYEGQALKPELIALLPGWEVLKDFGYNLLLRNTRQ